MRVQLFQLVLHQSQRFQPAVWIRFRGGGIRRQLSSGLRNRFQKQADVFVCAFQAVERCLGLMAQKKDLPGKLWPGGRFEVLIPHLESYT